jgi:hypothetical protein
LSTTPVLTSGSEFGGEALRTLAAAATSFGPDDRGLAAQLGSSGAGAGGAAQEGVLTTWQRAPTFRGGSAVRELIDLRPV